MGYAQGTKGFRIWMLEDEKVVISKDVVFHEECLFKQRDTVVGQMKEIEVQKLSKMKKKVTFKEELEEVEPETYDLGGADGKKEEVTVEASSSSEDESELTQEEDLSDYILARDRVRRKIKPPLKYEDADLIAYALASAEAIDQQEPRSFAEAKHSKDRDIWKGSMGEEMVSLDANHMWDLRRTRKLLAASGYIR